MAARNMGCARTGDSANTKAFSTKKRLLQALLELAILPRLALGAQPPVHVPHTISIPLGLEGCSHVCQDAWAAPALSRETHG